MAATNVSHGVITIDVKEMRPAKVAEFLQHEAVTSHPITSGAAPEPVVQHNTVSEVEAQSASTASEHVNEDAANAAPAA